MKKNVKKKKNIMNLFFKEIINSLKVILIEFNNIVEI